jgi:3-amino-4-hydroxybenzoic acid synthase
VVQVGTELWADVTGVGAEQVPSALARVRTSGATAVLARPDQLSEWERLERVQVVCLADGPGAVEACGGLADAFVVSDPGLLASVRAAAGGRPAGVRCEIADGPGMDAAAALCGSVDILVAAFADETNIPLELLLARAQGTSTRVLKELNRTSETSTVLGVLEAGPAGLVVPGDHLADLDRVAGAIRAQRMVQRELAELEVVRAEPAGMGFRGCIDTATLFGEDEGMIVGSTSHGGILVCAEVHYLPYMNLRPFRVNAGAVHSYVFGAEETAYITDLKSGERAYGVSSGGRFREVLVGRVKVELRPLRLIEARHQDVTVSALLQDDWHVRVMSAGGKPLNLTEVRPGTSLLGYVCAPGRHVGIHVAEQISEF